MPAGFEGDESRRLFVWHVSETARKAVRPRSFQEGFKLERTSSACGHAGRASVAACNLLAEPRSAVNEEAWDTLVAKFPSEDHVSVSGAKAAAELRSATDAENRNTPPWHLDDVHTSEVLFGVMRSRSGLSGPGNDGQLFAHLQVITHTDIGCEEFGRGKTAFWRSIVDEPDALPPYLWQIFLESSLTAFGESVGRFASAGHGGGLSLQGPCDSGGRGRRSTERRGSLGSPYPDEWSMWN